MEPNFENGDYLIIDEISYRLRDPERGEVIVFKYPNDPSQRYIKRIIGLPGETVLVKEGKVSIRNQAGDKILEETYLNYGFTTGEIETSLQEEEYFVLGDNRFVSSDSRRWGPVGRKNIIGRVFFRAWPFATLVKIETPTY